MNFKQQTFYTDSKCVLLWIKSKWEKFMQLFFGLFLITLGQHWEQRCGVLFTCMTVWGIHSEVTYSLTTNFAIMAIRRLVVRTGKLSTNTYDKESNLRGTYEEYHRTLAHMTESVFNVSEYINFKFRRYLSHHIWTVRMKGSLEASTNELESNEPWMTKLCLPYS